MHVLHSAIRYPPALGGVEAYVQGLTDKRFRTSAGTTATVLTTNLDSHTTGRPIEPTVREDDDSVIRLTARSVRGNWRYPRISGYWRAFATLAKSIDVVHGHAIYYPSFDNAVLSALRYSKPLVLSPYFYRRHRRFWNTYLRAVTALARPARPIYVAISRYERDLMYRHKAVPPTARVEVVPPVVDVPRQDAPYARDSCPNFTACYVGRISRSKGVLQLPAILNACVSSGLDLNLVVAGPDDDGALRPLTDALAERGLLPRVRLVGPVTDAEKMRVLMSSDFLLLPSDYEAFGIVLAEAMSVGCIPIAYATGAIPEVLDNGRLGMLVPPGDHHAFAQAIQALSGASAETLDQMRRDGREYVRTALGFERWIKDWTRIYRTAQQ